jgi:hypothetical protein
MFGADDNAIESCNWVSFDGKVFIPSMYNLTRSFGMDNTGYFVAPQNTLRPFMKNDILHSGTNSILWEKLCATFSDEISQRYAYLRANVLTVEKVKNVFENKISKIPAEIYEAEFTHFPDKKLMNCPETAETISKWFGSKCDILDNIFLK